MTGNMVTTTPRAAVSTAPPSVTRGGNQVNVVFGGGSGSTAVTVNGLGSLSGFSGSSQVTASCSTRPPPGAPSRCPDRPPYRRARTQVANGSITVPVSMTSTYGYHLVLTPGAGSPTLDGTYQIKNVNSGLALDTQNGGTAQGTLAVQATPGSGSTQTWKLISAGSGLYKIQNTADGLLLGVTNESTSAGADALIWGDNGTPDHLWSVNAAGNGQYKIANSHSGLLLGVTNMSKSSGALVLQWNDNGTADHLWTLNAR